ncbi:hypothetical protein Drorol1_Dr00003532 [Drosera rotundifolia]
MWQSWAKKMQTYPHSIRVPFPRRIIHRTFQSNALTRIHQTSEVTKTPTKSFKEDAKYYASSIQRCIEAESLEDLRKLQVQMMSCGFPHLSLGNKLIKGYLKCGGIEDALVVFDDLPKRHSVVWNSMISGYIRQRRSDDAVLLYRRMFFEGVLPDEFTLSVVFKGFSDLGFVDEGRLAHVHAVVLGLDVGNVFVGSALVNMYAKFGQMGNARRVADCVVEKDVVLFTALIVGYGQYGEDGEALEVFRCMLKQGVKANDYTFASVLASCGNLAELRVGMMIHGLTIKSGFESVVGSQTSVLTMYSKCGSICDSLRAFELVSNPNQVTWTSLISGLVQNNEEEIALSKFCKMLSSSTLPNSFTLSAALAACSSLVVLDQGRQLHTIVIKLGFDSQMFVGAALINFYGRCGCVEFAELAHDSLGELDMVPVNTLIHAYAQNGFGREAVELFHRMQDMGLEPNDVTLVSVLSACCNSRLADEGCQIFESFRRNTNMRLTTDHYTCMVDLLGRVGRLSEAEKLIDEVESSDLVLWRTLLNACKIHGDTARFERIMNSVLKLLPADEGTLVLSSNLYASMGNWSQVLNMKTRMRDAGLKKNPGMTWIDIDREIHTFKAGYFSHPNGEDIRDTLVDLILKVRQLGYVPDTSLVLQEMDEDLKEKTLYYHSEKIAIAFALWKTSCRITPIRIYKNLRVCTDCHTWIKLVSKVVGREIIARDAKRFHHFKNGSCSCQDFW